MNPKLANGRKLHYLGTGYVVLMDGDTERSARSPVGVWIGWEDIGHSRVVIEPLDTDLAGGISLDAIGHVTRAVCFLEDDGPILEWPVHGVYEKDRVALNLQALYESML